MERHPGLALCLCTLAAALTVNSLLGPFAFDVIDYSLSESLHNQLVGLDAATLFLVAPISVAAAALVWRQRSLGAALALGPATYTSYMFVQYVVGPGYLRYPAVLFFHLGLFVLGGVVAVLAWTSLQPGDLPYLSARARRARSLALLALATFIVVRYLPAIAGSITGDDLTAEFRTEPAFFWTIVLMDLGVVVPAAVATAVGLRDDRPSARKATYGIVGWFALVPPSVAAMAITMVVNDDPHGSTSSAALFLLAAAAFAWFALRVFHPLSGRDQPQP